MATGSGRRNSGQLNEVQLVYPGKKTESEILNADYPEFQKVRTHGAGQNLLFDGDNLAAMAHLVRSMKLAESVDFVYIDPPYASQSSFESRTQKAAYNDHLVGAEYLECLRERLILIRELLKATGSICVHIDERMSSYVRVLLDEVFGPNNFRNEITRVKSNPKNYTRKTFGNVADRILFYSKGANYKWNRPFTSWTDETSLKEYTYTDEATGRRFKKVPVHAPGVRNGETGGPWRGMSPPPGKHWQYRPSTLDEMDARGEIYWSSTGNPRRKVFLEDSPGIALQDVWLDVKDPHNQNAKITGYPTEKNPIILERLIEAFTEPGDLVMDCYLGSGTTADVAQNLGRRWIGVDESPEAMDTITNRLKFGTQKMGDFKDKPEESSDLLFELQNELDFQLYKAIS